MSLNMYNKEYAERWIRFEESGRDIFRVRHLHPFLKESVSCFLLNGSRLLDVGCGWGDALMFVPRFRGFEYVGVDVNPHLLAYTRERYPIRNGDRLKIGLKEGGLPSDIPAEAGSFDMVLCSMALHCVEELETSVETLFSKAKKNGKVIVTEFNDKAAELVRGAFLRVDEESKNHVRGLYRLCDGINILSEAYFHREAEIEAELAKHGRFDRCMLGPIFTGYSARKTR